MIDTSRILITGSQGQLGKAFQSVFPDAMFTSRIELDLSWESRKIISAVEELQPSAIIHTAAYTNVDGAESDRTTALRVNADATGALVECCRKHDVPIIYYSTDYVLDSNPINGHSESELPNPHSIYGVSKYIGELYVGTYNKGTVIRISSVFGDGKNFVQTMLKLSKTLNEIPVVCDQFMRPSYAPDVANATRELMKRYWIGEEWKLPRMIHMQNSGPAVNWADYAAKIFSLVGKNTHVKQVTFSEYLKSRSGKPMAPRPANSLFKLSLLNSLGVSLRNWTEALDEFCLSTSSPK